MRETAFRIVAAAGLLLLIVGTALYPIGAARSSTSALLSIAGAALLIVSALANLRSLAAFFKKRQARHGANAILMTLLFAAIIVIIQAISIRNTHRYDVTRNQRFTLSEQTRSLLDQLDGDVVFTAFLRKHTDQWSRGEAILNMYKNQGRNVRVELIDPDEKPHIAEKFRAKSGDVIVEYNDNRRKTSGLSEEDLTNALLFASRQRPEVVYFVSGHDEKQLDGGGPTGLRTARQGLENIGFLTRELSLVEVDSIPPDCAVLVLAGPKKEYLQSEVDRIERYLAGGGSVLFLLDPRWPISHLQTILTRYYIDAYDYVLLDELVVVDTGIDDFDATYTKISTYSSHPITKGLRAITIFPMARPLAIEPNQDDFAVNVQYLAVTGKSAWGETDMNSFKIGSATRDQTDLPPPLGVAVVAERTDKYDAPRGKPHARERKSKIVVVGDSDFATNRFYRLLGNSDFFLNAIEYLAEEQIVIPIRPKKDLGDRVYITASQGRLIFVLCLVLLPLMVASLGGYVLMRKRRIH